MMTNIIIQAESDKESTIDTFTYEELGKNGLQKKNLMKQAIAL
jgi:hypothetical protein